MSLDLEALYVAHHGQLQGFIAKRMVGADPAAVEDMTADVFERAVRAAPRYQDRGIPASAWLYQIARNLITDHWRHHALLQIGYLDETRPPYVKDIGSDGHLERLVVADALETLTPLQRATIVGRFYEGRRHDEMGHIATLHGSKKLQGRALVNLRKRLEAA
jgi:RNA polymerase sigma-70 factor (ECF subfamily)